MKKQFTTLALLTAGLAVALVVHAQEADVAEPEEAARPAEFQCPACGRPYARRPEGRNARRPARRPAPQQLLERFDADGDGVLSAEERATARASRPENALHGRQQLLERFDTDGNGELSKEERAGARAQRPENARRGGRRRLLERFDIDSDGELSGAERAAMKAYRTARMAERGDAAPAAAD